MRAEFSVGDTQAARGAESATAAGAREAAAGAPETVTAEHMVVAIAPDEDADFAEQLLRAAQRLAAALTAQWTVVSVETPAFLRTAAPQRDVRIDMFRLAESLGAETVTMVAASPPDAIREYAELHGARTIIAGAPRRAAAWRWLRESTASALLRLAADADVILISRGAKRGAASPGARPPASRRALMAYAAALGLTVLCTAVALPMLDHFDLIDMVMVYMLGATLAALRLGRGPAIVNSLANIAAFDFFFVPPRFSFFVSDPHYMVTFGVILVVAIIIANLVSAVQQQTLAAVSRERRTAALYAMSRELAVTREADGMADVAERIISEVAHGPAIVLVCDERGRLRQRPSATGRTPDLALCQWVVEHRQRAGHGSAQFGADRCIYLPLIGSQDARGVLVLRPADPKRALLPEQSRLLEALGHLLAVALERARLAQVAESARLSAERAALRNTLLASISHDLRTPLSAIAGAGSMMAQDSFPLDAHRRTTLGHLIEDKARDMTELLSNVLELMRLETGMGAVKRDWYLLEDLVGQTLRQNEGRLARWRVFVDLPADLPMLYVEAGLIVQILSNVVENCTKHTPPETRIAIAARTEDEQVVISVEDDGPGFGSTDTERLFDKFERGRAESNVAGAGLGLAICRAVARLHGGDIRAMNGRSGGACFEITLPQPAVTREAVAGTA